MAHVRKRQITVYSTNKCNMQCVYCVSNSGAEQGNKQEIDVEFLRCGISDYFLKEGGHQIRFYSSGEPTQAMHVLKEAVKFAKGLVGEKLIVEMQTNAYFDIETAEWIRDNVNIVWVSIDGWPELNNRLRPVVGDHNPTQKVIKNILFMQKKTFVGARATIVSETALRQVELVEFFKNLGITQVYAEPMFEPVTRGERSDNSPITQLNIFEYAKGYIEAWNYSVEIGTFYGNSFMVNFDEKTNVCCRSCLPTPHLTTDGFVSTCDLGYYGDTPLSDLIYGRFNKRQKRIDYFSDKINKIRARTAENMKGCQGCEILLHCAGGCLGRAYHETGSMFGVVKDYCWLTKYLAKHLPRDQIKIEYLHP